MIFSIYFESMNMSDYRVWVFERNVGFTDRLLDYFIEKMLKQRTRVLHNTFKFLYKRLGLYFQKETTWMREAMSIESRVTMLLQRLGLRIPYIPYERYMRWLKVFKNCQKILCVSLSSITMYFCAKDKRGRMCVSDLRIRQRWFPLPQRPQQRHIEYQLRCGLDTQYRRKTSDTHQQTSHLRPQTRLRR